MPRERIKPRTKPLTRSEMEEIVKRGESVLYQGRFISRVGDLPGEAELAEGDKAAEDAILASKEAQITQLQKERDDVLARRAMANTEKAKDASAEKSKDEAKGADAAKATDANAEREQPQHATHTTTTTHTATEHSSKGGKGAGAGR